MPPASRPAREWYRSVATMTCCSGRRATSDRGRRAAQAARRVRAAFARCDPDARAPCKTPRSSSGCARCPPIGLAAGFLAMAGDEAHAVGVVAMGQGNAGVGRAAGRRRDTRNDRETRSGAARAPRSSSPPRPKMNGSPPFSRTTRRPRRACSIKQIVDRVLGDTGAAGGFADSRSARHRAARNRAPPPAPVDRAGSHRRPAGRAAPSSVRSSGSPGPAPTSVTSPERCGRDRSQQALGDAPGAALVAVDESALRRAIHQHLEIAPPRIRAGDSAPHGGAHAGEPGGPKRRSASE